jgi:RHS repeat-associated protein
MQILYSYDDLNRTTEIKRYVDGSNDEVLLDQVQYSTDNLITQFDYGNDLRATFSYDARDRISTIDVRNNETSYLDLDYTYDNNNNITQLVNGWRDIDFDWNSDSEIYSYDGLNRLTSASCTSWSHTYSYDNVGNRTSRDSITYTINAVNEVTALSDGTSFTYNSNGNRTQKTKDTDTWVYTYDCANRLTRIEKNNTTLGEYVYDGDGKRLQVTETSVTTTYIHSGLNVLYEENTNRSATYIYGLTGLIAKRATINEESHTYFYHTDHVGSTRLVTDENKNIVSAITYHPFGEVDIKEGSEDFLFTGKEIDSTGLYYYCARYYDSEIGRFITRDSWTYLPNDLRSFGQAVVQWMSDPQIFNRYSYCRNNPLMYTDPSGHGWLKKIGLAICVSLAAASIFLALCAIVFATGGLAAGPIIWFILSCYAGYETVTAFVMECLSSGRVYTQKIYMHDLDKNVEGDEKVVGVEQFNKEGELIGGWKLGENENGEKGYLVWDEEKGAYVFVSENEWKPPSLAKSGENQKPITIQNHPLLWWVPEPEPSSPLNPFTGMWPQQENGVQAGTRSYVI